MKGKYPTNIVVLRMLEENKKIIENSEFFCQTCGIMIDINDRKHASHILKRLPSDILELGKKIRAGLPILENRHKNATPLLQTIKKEIDFHEKSKLKTSERIKVILEQMADLIDYIKKSFELSLFHSCDMKINTLKGHEKTVKKHMEDTKRAIDALKSYPNCLLSNSSETTPSQALPSKKPLLASKHQSKALKDRERPFGKKHQKQAPEEAAAPQEQDLSSHPSLPLLSSALALSNRDISSLALPSPSDLHLTDYGWICRDVERVQDIMNAVIDNELKVFKFMINKYRRNQREGKNIVRNQGIGGLGKREREEREGRIENIEGIEGMERRDNLEGIDNMGGPVRRVRTQEEGGLDEGSQGEGQSPEVRESLDERGNVVIDLDD